MLTQQDRPRSPIRTVWTLVSLFAVVGSSMILLLGMMSIISARRRLPSKEEPEYSAAREYFTGQLTLQTKDIEFEKSQAAFVEETVNQIMPVFLLESPHVEPVKFWNESEKWVAREIKKAMAKTKFLNLTSEREADTAPCESCATCPMCDTTRKVTDAANAICADAANAITTTPIFWKPSSTLLTSEREANAPVPCKSCATCSMCDGTGTVTQSANAIAKVNKSGYNGTEIDIWLNASDILDQLPGNCYLHAEKHMWNKKNDKKNHVELGEKYGNKNQKFRVINGCSFEFSEAQHANTFIAYLEAQGIKECKVSSSSSDYRFVSSNVFDDSC